MAIQATLSDLVEKGLVADFEETRGFGGHGGLLGDVLQSKISAASQGCGALGQAWTVRSHVVLWLLRPERDLFLDERFALEHHEAPDHVLELADITRPRVLLEQAHRLARDGGHLPVVLEAELAEEVLRQHGDLFPPRSQRGNGNRDHVEAIVQVLAELPARHQGGEIPIGGGDQSHVGGDELGPAHAEELPVLDDVQDGKFFSVGGTELISADVRLIAATNRNLAALVTSGQFREDLYYRLNVVTIPIPPLRTRREEIPVLTQHFLSKFCLQYNREMPAISSETMRLFQEYSWPGNVRELENMIRRLVVLQSEALVQEEIALRMEKPQYDMTPHGPGLAKSAAALRGGRDLGLKDIAKKAAMAAEAAAIKDVLERVRWNRAETARLLKISYKALLYKIRQCGLDGHKTDGRGK